MDTWVLSSFFEKMHEPGDRSIFVTSEHGYEYFCQKS